MFSILGLGILAVFILAETVLFVKDKYLESFGVMAASIAAAYFFLPDVHMYMLTNWLHILTVYVPIYLGIGIVVAFAKWFSFVFGIRHQLVELRETFVPPKSDEEVIAAGKEAFKADHAAWLKEKDAMHANTWRNGSLRFEPKEPTDEDILRAYDSFFRKSPEWRKRNAFMHHVGDKIGVSRLLKRTPAQVDLDQPDALVVLFTPRARHYTSTITVWILQWPFVLLAMVFEDLIVKIGKWVAQLFDAIFHKVSRLIIGSAVKDM